ncbi:RNA-binding S4 domain-containing protein [Hydrogenophaga sp.]|uniref:RNA-binding S4 domain-containing protein n=1 Tax=Hydrogenophaga sp. TaxID=1904254 RepID=UPI0025C3BCD6|nr:RNA-binding S4 domain-containing protein [Hydrogenophaga sp.]
MSPPAATDKVRLDKWLWAARFYKTRSLSTEAIDKGRVRLNGLPTKPSRDVKPGDRLELHVGAMVRTVVVQALSSVRGSATLAAGLFEETPESIAERLALAEQRRLAPEPAHSLAQGRPTKRDRRDLQGLRETGGWNDRWSASIED